MNPTDRTRKALRIGLAIAAGGGLLAALFVWLPRGPGGQAPRIDRVDAPAVEGPAQSFPPSPLSEPAPKPVANGTGATDLIPITGLSLRLLSVALQPESGPSIAAIRDDWLPEPRLMMEGHVFEGRPQVTLETIEEASVLLDNDGTLERLLLDPDGRLSLAALTGEEPARPHELTDEERARRRKLASRLRALTDAGEGAESLLRAGNERRGGVLAQGDVQPLYEDGEMVGLELSAIEPGSLYEEVGLRSGDVLMSLNGVPLSDTPQLIAELASAEKIEVEVVRSDGSTEQVTMSAEDLFEKLQSLP